ncbi:hypothetical protein PMAYCL1PPCAC_20319, partial [Pristionchus mayeri]
LPENTSIYRTNDGDQKIRAHSIGDIDCIANHGDEIFFKTGEPESDEPINLTLYGPRNPEQVHKAVFCPSYGIKVSY